METPMCLSVAGVSLVIYSSKEVKPHLPVTGLFPSVPLTSGARPRHVVMRPWRLEPTGSRSTQVGLRLRKGTAQNTDCLAFGH